MTGITELAPEAPRKSIAASRRLLVAALAVVIAACLLVLAVPRTIAAWWSMDGYDAYLAIAAGKAPSDALLDQAIAGLERAVAWVPSGQRYYMLAGAEAEKFRRAPTGDPNRLKWLERAEENAGLALGATPTDGRAALLLATLRLWRGVTAREIAVPLLQSMDANPNMRELWLWRASLLFVVWPALMPDEAQAVESQMRTIWRFAPAMRRPLVEAARATGRIPALTHALADEPGATAELAQLQSNASGSKP